MLDGARVVAFAHERDVGGDVDVRGAHCLAREVHLDFRLAGMLDEVALVFVGKDVEALEHGRGRFPADGAIGGVADQWSARFLTSSSREASASQSRSLAEHPVELRQPVAAGDALAAGLCCARLGQGDLERDRAHAGWRRADAAVEFFHERGDARIHTSVWGDSHFAHGYILISCLWLQRPHHYDALVRLSMFRMCFAPQATRGSR